MGNVVTAMTTELSSANLWGVVGSLVPLIGVSVLFALGYRIFKKVTEGISKHKNKE